MAIFLTRLPGHSYSWLEVVLPLEHLLLLFFAFLPGEFHFLTQTTHLWDLILGEMSWQGFAGLTFAGWVVAQ